MKVWLIATMFFISICVFSQERNIVPMKGKIFSSDSVAVGDAYIINLKGLLYTISETDGSFRIWADPRDTLVITHISFVRKIVLASDVVRTPDIYLEGKSIMLKQVVVGGNQKTPEKYLEKTVEMIKNADITIYKRMNPELDQVSSTVIENNSILRSQASSVSLMSFSPSRILDMALKGKNKQENQKGFNFYRNEKQRVRKEKKNAKE